jgi:hypothetical protein
VERGGRDLEREAERSSTRPSRATGVRLPENVRATSASWAEPETP